MGSYSWGIFVSKRIKYATFLIRFLTYDLIVSTFYLYMANYMLCAILLQLGWSYSCILCSNQPCGPLVILDKRHHCHIFNLHEFHKKIAVCLRSGHSWYKYFPILRAFFYSPLVGLHFLLIGTMFNAASLLSTLLLAVLVAGNPVVVRDNLVRLPIAKRVNATNARDVLRIDQARAAALRARGNAKAGKFVADAGSISVTNQAVDYVATVGVGSPATDCMQFFYACNIL